ncbi:MAG: hypothetical protein PHU23_02060 [Dehalococcoidales bacterium]|nr:hypothetical protein [Dehalococcoidales bacterium]
MIAGVTTSTVVSVTSMVGLGLVTAVTLIAVLNWLGLLTARVLLSASPTGSTQHINRFLSVGIIPFTIVFIVIFSVKLVEILG